MRISDFCSDVVSSYLSFQHRDLEPAPMLETLRSNWKVIAAGAFPPLASFAMFHMVTVFPLSWVFLFTNETPASSLLVEAVAAFVGLRAILVSGPPPDRHGSPPIHRKSGVLGNTVQVPVD